MIKNFSNMTSTPKVSVKTKFIKGGEIQDTKTKYSGFDSSWHILVNIKVSGLTSKQKISNSILKFIYKNLNQSCKLKISSISNDLFTDSIVEDNYMTNVSNYLKKYFEVIELENTNEELEIASIDLTKLLVDQNQNTTNPEITLLITNTLQNSVFEVYDIQSYDEEPVCYVTCCEHNGMNSLQSFHNFELENCGKGYLNLYTGKLFHFFDDYCSMDKNNPIALKTFLSIGDQLDISIKHNYQMKANKYNGYYEIIDSTGNKTIYYLADLSKNSQFKELYNIDVSKGENVYFCEENNTYFHLITDETYDTLKMYDKNKNYYEYHKINNTDILNLIKVVSSKGHIQEFNWSADQTKLSSISNGEGEELYLGHNSDDSLYIVQFFMSENRFQKILYEENKIIIQLYKGLFTDSSATLLEEKEIIVDKLSSTIKIYDSLEEKSLVYFFENGKVYKVVKLDKNEEIIKSLEYQYNEDGTIFVDNYLNVTQYYFDYYGRCITTLDNKGRSTSYNYDLYENGMSKNMIGKSHLQNNGPNLLTNASFESNDLSSWIIQGNTNSQIEVVAGGIYGNNCLSINAAAEDNIVMFQPIKYLNLTNYYLTGFMKINSGTITDGMVTISLIGGYLLNGESKSFEQKITDFSSYLEWKHFKLPNLMLEAGAIIQEMYLKITINEAQCNLLIDQLQLSSDKINTRFNLLGDGYFLDTINNIPVGWNHQHLDVEDITIDNISHNSNIDILNNKMWKIESKEVNLTTQEVINKTISKTVSMTGLINDSLFLSVFCNCNITSSIILRAFMKIHYVNKGEKTYYFDFAKNCRCWQVLSRTLKAEDSYDFVEVGVEYNGCEQALFGCFQLYKDVSQSYFNYDSIGNLTDQSSAQLVYDSQNRIYQVYDESGNMLRFTYNSDGRVSEIFDIYGNYIKYYYDTNGNVVQKLYKAGSSVLSTQNTYDEKNNLITQTDEFGRTTINTYNEQKQLISVTSPNGLIKEYNYNSDGTINYAKASDNNVSKRHNFTYDDAKRIQRVTAPSVPPIIYNYDARGNMIRVCEADMTINSYSYTKEINGVKQSLVTRKTYGDNHSSYNYDYDNEGNLSFITNEGGFKYDENGNISTIYDIANNKNKYYYYDSTNKLVKTTDTNNNSINYSYDNIGNLNNKSYTIDGKTKNISYYYDYHLLDQTKEGYFKKLGEIYCDDTILSETGARGVYGAVPLTKKLDFIKNEELNIYTYDFASQYNFICYDMKLINSTRSGTYSNNKVFNLKNWQKGFKNCKSIYAWIKPKSESMEISSAQNIFAFQNNNSIISNCSLTTSGTLAYYCGDNLIAQTNNGINLNAWNLVGIKIFYDERDSTFNAVLSLNGITTAPFLISQKPNDIKYLYVSYHDIDVSIEDEQRLLDLPFEMCFMSIGAYDYSSEDFKTIYDTGLSCLATNTLNRYDGLSYYDSNVFSNFDIVSLNGTFTSQNALKPIELYLDNKLKNIFYYDAQLYKQVLDCGENSSSYVKYKINLSDAGTITYRFKPLSVSNEFVLLQATNASIGQFLITYRNGTIYLIMNQNTVSGSYTLNTSNWYQLTLTYDNNNLMIYINSTKVIELALSAPIQNGEFDLCFGKTKISGKSSFNGYIDMIAFSSSFSNLSKISQLIVYSKAKVAFYKKNQTNQIQRQAYISSTGSIINTSYLYDKTRVSSEIYNNGYRINYVYSTTDNNIITKTILFNGSLEDQISYTYDKFNQLLSETHSDGRRYIYTYDINGNILTKKVYNNAGLQHSYTYTYDSTYKNKLITIVDAVSGEQKQYNYNSKNRLLLDTVISSLSGTNSFVWDKNKLMQFNGSQYLYNCEGQRIQKITPQENTTYVLENNKILSMKKTSNGILNRLDFIYDAYDRLIGFELEGITYYYKKDITGIIRQLVDENNQIVVKYDYDAFGKVTKRILVNIPGAQHNPFVYKDYYLDDESGYYYCDSRYYNPEVGRFIQPADVSSLNPSSINGLNLYSYANNNPIGIAYCSSNVGFGTSGGMVNSLALGGLSSPGYNLGYSNSFNIFAGLNWPQFNALDLTKDIFISLGEVGSRIAWGLTKNGRTFLDFHYSAYGINGYTALDNLPSTSAKTFKGIGFGLMALDVIEAGYYSYQNGHSFGQGALNVGLTAGKNILVYKASTGVATAVGTWAGAKLGASLGSYAGPVGFAIGAVAGAVVGWVIDEFGDVIIDWVVGWFD